MPVAVAAATVPDTFPELAPARPGGSVPEIKYHVYGGLPPLALRAAVYATPCVALGSVGKVVIAKTVATGVLAERATPAEGRVSKSIVMKPVTAPAAEPKYVTCSGSLPPGATAVLDVNPVTANG